MATGTGFSASSLQAKSVLTLKLTHPEVVPRGDRIAAPKRSASWIRFETE